MVASIPAAVTLPGWAMKPFRVPLSGQDLTTRPRNLMVSLPAVVQVSDGRRLGVALPAAPPVLSRGSNTGYKRVIVTPAVYPRLVEFLHFDIQSTGQKSHCVSIL